MEILQNIPVEYPANPSVEPMLKRAYIALEDEDWEKAEELFDQILNEAPECALAYLGLSMQTAAINRLEDFFGFFMLEDSKDKNLRRAKQFSEGALKARFEEEERRKAERATLLPPALERAAAARGVLLAEGDRLLAEKADGTILSSDGDTDLKSKLDIRGRLITAWGEPAKEKRIKVYTDGSAELYEGGYRDEKLVRSWTGIAAAALIGDGGWLSYYWLLKEDGTITDEEGNARARGGYSFGNIINFASTGHLVAFVNMYGRVMVFSRVGQYDVSNWRDIVSVAVGKEFVAGLKADGTLVVEGKCKGKERVTGWKLFNSIDTLDEERKQHARDDLQKDIDTLSDRLVERAEEEDRIQEELSHLKGLFTGQRRKELEHRLEVIGNDQEFMLRKIKELEAEMKEL